jgi:hypothetical protein
MHWGGRSSDCAKRDNVNFQLPSASKKVEEGSHESLISEKAFRYRFSDDVGNRRGGM